MFMIKISEKMDKHCRFVPRNMYICSRSVEDFPTTFGLQNF